MNETRIGGLTLLLGAAIILITIYFEYSIGWIGVERPKELVPQFMLENWDKLRKIWAWQGCGYALFTIAYLLFLKTSKGLHALIWAVLLICGILLVVAMGITVGSYYPALQLYETQPALFGSIRGAVLSLYTPGKFGSSVLTVMFVLETMRKEGTIQKWLGLVTLGLVLSSILLFPLLGLSMKTVGATWFLLPVVLGYAYVKTPKDE